MNVSKIAIALGLTSILTTGSVFADQGSGQITFSGTIIDAACSIASDSENQEIDLGQVSIADLTDADKESKPTPFDITLENCVIDDTTAKSVSLTFTGPGASFNPDILGVTGTASGVGVAIVEQNSSGAYLPLGTPSSQQNLAAGSNQLHFAAVVKGDAAPTEGDFSAVTNFTMAYQ